MSGRTLVTITIVVMIAAVAAGTWVLGSPTAARRLRFDEMRVDDLTALVRAVDHRRSVSNRLPDTLAELTRDSSVLDLQDPATAQPYEYRVVSADSYHLCAVFQRPSPTGATSWRHGSGRHCFTLHSR